MFIFGYVTYIHWKERDLYHQMEKVKHLEPERKGFYFQGNRRQPTFVFNTTCVVDLHEDRRVTALRNRSLSSNGENKAPRTRKKWFLFSRK
jgi:hypothetical protein